MEHANLLAALLQHERADRLLDHDLLLQRTGEHPAVNLQLFALEGSQVAIHEIVHHLVGAAGAAAHQGGDAC
jgi:hypothetical protein